MIEETGDEAERTMVVERTIAAARSKVWAAWINEETLPQWWGPDGFTCRTKRINLRSRGEWVFDMIGPDGTVYPNHHLYRDIVPEDSIDYVLLWGENGPEHARVHVSFSERDGATHIVMTMVFASIEECRKAMDMGAAELGQQTLGKLEAFVSRP
ncbi:SRPBCC domain-containing protein [Aurantiacibacter luteus]|uniref:SRPBCC domain-containing protein n=1 Tax=Aurantiacibacter luteus TaxID=1581420 RepID=UPI0009E469C0|nr:SRPBCC domain-containing protein [Aurantiacibacter luteus]